MAQYRVRYVDVPANAVRESMVVGSSVAAARSALEADGRIVLEIEVARRSLASLLQGIRGPERLKPREVALLCHELRTLLVAGLSVVEALEALAQAQPGEGGAEIGRAHV